MVGRNTIFSMIVQDLRSKNQGQLIDIIKKAQINIEVDNYDDYYGIVYYTMKFYLKYIDYFEISGKKKIYEDILTTTLHSFYNDDKEVIRNIEIHPIIKQYVDWIAVPNENKESVIKKLNEESELLTKSCTGQTKINNVNTQYQDIHMDLVNILKQLCIEHVNPFKSLWEWYGYYNKNNLSSYQSRRDFIKQMYDPLINIINDSDDSITQMTQYIPTGWKKVDETALRMKEVLINPSITTDYQAVGLFGRDCLLSLALVVIEKDKHPSIDDTNIQSEDAKRMLVDYIQHCQNQNVNSNAIKIAKESVKLSNRLTHNRTATSIEAELCYSAVISTIDIIRILYKYDKKESSI